MSRWSVRTWMIVVCHVAVVMASFKAFPATDPVSATLLLLTNLFVPMVVLAGLIVRTMRKDLHDPKTLDRPID